jgi:hypothetical protein
MSPSLPQTVVNIVDSDLNTSPPSAHLQVLALTDA